MVRVTVVSLHWPLPHHFVFGENPSQITYIQYPFCNHLVSCIEGKHLTNFPSRGKTKKAQDELSNNLQHLLCLPESGRMICCNLCNKWYQDVCVNSPKEAWEKRNLEWFCNSCSLFFYYLLLVIFEHTLLTFSNH